MRSLLLACAALILSLFLAPAVSAQGVDACNSGMSIYPGVPAHPECPAAEIRYGPCYDAAALHHQQEYKWRVQEKLQYACVLSRMLDFIILARATMDAGIASLQTDLANASAACAAGDLVACDLAAYYQTALTELQARRAELDHQGFLIAAWIDIEISSATAAVASIDAAFVLAVSRCCFVPGSPPPQPLAPEVPADAPAALHVALAGLTL